MAILGGYTEDETNWLTVFSLLKIIIPHYLITRVTCPVMGTLKHWVFVSFLKNRILERHS